MPRNHVLNEYISEHKAIGETTALTQNISATPLAVQPSVNWQTSSALSPHSLTPPTVHTRHTHTPAAPVWFLAKPVHPHGYW